MPKTLYLIRGISGSGKSSLAAALTEYAIASDDMPGLYEGGVYQIDLQAKSHRWCLDSIELWMYEGRERVAAANTFVKQKYFEEYLKLAAKYGYAVQIIHCEGVLLPEGTQATSIHNVPPEVLRRQCENWEPWTNTKSTQLITRG